MESSECFHGSLYSDANTHLAPEKKAGGGVGDHFAVEDLLDFSNKEESGVLVISGDDGNAGNSTDSSTVTAVDIRSNSSGPEPHYSTHHVCRSFTDAGLCESQYDELAELEWLSNFVEESFSTEDLHNFILISGVNSTTCKTAAVTRAEVSSHDVAGGGHQLSPRRPCVNVPGKARSKRSRVAPRNWSSRLSVLSPSQTAACSPESELIVLPGPAAAVGVEKAAPKPAPRKKDPSTGAAFAAAEGRKCLHCQTDKTPQWRTGPMGPKTLCNACGVRFKSGRLVPEYRPAASPTFMVSKHSNSHRKVLELRRQKELQQQLHAGGAATSHFDGLSTFSTGGGELLINDSNFQHLNWQRRWKKKSSLLRQ